MIKKICLVTTEIPRPNTWDGHGAHFSALMTTLAQEGHEVSIVLVDSGATPAREFGRWQEFFGHRKINFIRPPSDFEQIQTVADASSSYCIYKWLRTMDFDVVHFCERAGLGYYTLLARHQGLAFQSTELVVNLVGGLARFKNSVGELLSSEADLVVDFLERESCRLAPIRVALTASKKSEADELFTSGKTVHLPPLSLVDKTDDTGLTRDSLVYCGQVGRNDDLMLFCDAVDALPSDEVSKLKIIFLGAMDSADNVFSYVADRARKWNTTYGIASATERASALVFLRARARLAVLFPSLGPQEVAVENCLQSGVSFVEPTRGDLSALIASRLRQPKIAKANVDPETALKGWLEFHSRPRPESVPAIAASPSISICLVHKDRPTFLRQALKCLRDQTYEDFEVIVVDNDSAEQSYLDEIESSRFPFEVTVIRSGQSCPSVARNLAAKRAKRSHLLFMDDDNLAKPMELAVFANAAMHSNADIYVCAHTKFVDPHPDTVTATWLPLGPLLALGVRYNIFGDTNFLVKRDVFLGLEGFVEKTFYGEDWEFLSRAVFAGRRLEVIPEALYLYREHSQNLSKRLPRVSGLRLRPYVNANHPDMEGFLQVSAHGAPVLPSRERERGGPRTERASIFMSPEKLQSRITELLDLETVQGSSSLRLTRAGADPRMLVSLPSDFEGALDLEIWVSAPRSQQLKIYWKKRSCSDYLEANSLLAPVRGELVKMTFVISDPARSGALRFDLEGDGDVLDIHALRINSMSTKEGLRDERVLRAAVDHASALRNGEIYLNGVALGLDQLRTSNCKMEKLPELIRIEALTDDPQIDLSYVMNMTSNKFMVVFETESSPRGHFKIFWNEPYAIFSEERAREFPVEPAGALQAFILESNNSMSGLRLDPIDKVGTVLIRKIFICTEDFLWSETFEI